MKNPSVIIAPDSFKGTLSAGDVAGILAKAIKDEMPGAGITEIPIADGGEGTLDCFERIYGGEAKLCRVTVTGPDFRPVSAKILLKDDLAVIEMAQAAGLPLVEKKDAKSTTTYGVGEMIAEASRLGAKRFILGLGGSATNDGGCGMAAALGTRFFDGDGKEFVPVGATLCNIEKIEFGPDFDITALCDVKNPLYGETGAAYIYAPQKGANEEDVLMLDNGLRHFAQVLARYGKDVSSLQGAGAAGGLGAGVVALCGGRLRRGIDTILDLAGFDDCVGNADFVITGEGALDSQSFCGKVIDGIIFRSRGARILACVGISKLDNPAEYGIEAVFESNFEHKPFDEIVATAREDMCACATEVSRYISRSV